MGKTAFGLHQCMQVARKKRKDVQYAAAFFSLEMPKWQLSLRLACSDALIDQAQARLNRLTDHDRAKLSKSINYLCTLPIYVDETSPMTPLEMRAKVRRLQSKLAPYNIRLGLVVCDYLQLFTPSGSNGRMSRREAVDCVARELKQTAVQTGVPIMALAQLNRASDASGEGRRPNLSDLREAGEIEQAADAVLFLYRPGYYKTKGEEEKAPPADEPEDSELILSKQRNGPTGIAHCWYRRMFVRFDDKDRDERD